MRNHKNNEPREIFAKYDCKCAETGVEIKRNDSCIYYPLTKLVFTHESKQAQEFREMKADDQMTGHQY